MNHNLLKIYIILASVVKKNQVVDHTFVRVSKNNKALEYKEWGPIFSITMDVKIDSWGSGWTSLFRVTNTDGNCCKNGQRYPAVFMNDNKYLHVTTSLNNNGNRHWNLRHIPVDKVFKLAISQTKVYINTYSILHVSN